MARSKDFDEAEVLNKALDLFQRQGYEATSVRDLTAELGISSSSLYATFGDKRALYLQTLAHYRAQEVIQVKDTLAAEGPALVTLRRFFDNLIESRLSADEGGSFTLNAAVELGTRDKAVGAQLEAHLADLTAALATYLFTAQATGEIDDRFAPDDLAHYLLGSLYSLGIMADVTLNRYQLERVATITLALLEPQPTGRRSADKSTGQQHRDNQSDK